MNKEQQVEADAKPFKLDEFPGLDAAVDAFEEQCGSSYGEPTEHHMKRAMNALASAGWKFKPAKKVKLGKTIREALWADLDAVMARLMEDGEGAEQSDKGEAFGLARAIALMDDPFAPDIDAIRAEAMERWEEGANNG